jgi:hypothetical protein
MADARDEMAADDQEAITFPAFVLSLAHTAALHFGDLPDPLTGQPLEANLLAAKQMIDILALLEEKTRGNLSLEERQLLEQILYELRLRYVDAEKEGGGQEPQSRIIIP